MDWPGNSFKTAFYINCILGKTTDFQLDISDTNTCMPRAASGHPSAYARLCVYVYSWVLQFILRFPTLSIHLWAPRHNQVFLRGQSNRTGEIKLGQGWNMHARQCPMAIWGPYLSLGTGPPPARKRGTLPRHCTRWVALQNPAKPEAPKEQGDCNSS